VRERPRGGVPAGADREHRQRARELRPHHRAAGLLVEGDRGRPLSAMALALIIFVSAIGTVIRAHMRGVVVHSDGIEGRYLLALGIPRVRRWAWAQVHRMLVDDTQVMLELWDGTYERLPEVQNTHKLVELLENIAGSRRIEMTHLSPVDLTKKR
jgi:hypothetical protein